MVIRDHSDAGDISSNLKKQGKIIVFTNGCFDIFHAGHVHSLKFARSQGDVLFVGINSDESISRIKGPERPIIPLEKRILVLDSCRFVDYVVPFDDDTPEKLISRIKPHVIVKGEDWKGKQIAGQEIVQYVGGKVVFAPLLNGISTTYIVKKIKNITDS